jgi:hypothetical protein
VSPPVQRPLTLGELFAETVRLYGERPPATLAVGALLAGGILVARSLPLGADLAILSLALTACYAASSRLVSGDGFMEACAQVLVRSPALLFLTVVVSVPLALALTDLLFLFLVVAWIALTGFSIPVAMIEGGCGWMSRLGHSLYRSLTLARVEYLHALGIVAALALVWLLLGRLLAQALVGFAESGGFVAFLLVQLVVAPFFFLGLSVLYYEQRARAAVSSRREAP